MDDDALDRWHFDISVANLSIEVSGSANLYRLKCDNLDQKDAGSLRGTHPGFDL